MVFGLTLRVSLVREYGRDVGAGRVERRVGGMLVGCEKKKGGDKTEDHSKDCHFGHCV